MKCSLGSFGNKKNCTQLLRNNVSPVIVIAPKSLFQINILKNWSWLFGIIVISGVGRVVQWNSALWSVRLYDHLVIIGSLSKYDDDGSENVGNVASIWTHSESKSSIKRQIRRFHVVVVQWTPDKCTKKRDARAELLFWSLNLLLFWSRRCGRRCSCLHSLMTKFFRPKRKNQRVILVFWSGCLCDHLAITTTILWPHSGRINIPVLSDSGEKKDDPYSNWDVTANPIVFLVIGCLFLDIMCFFLEEGEAQSSYRP